MAVPLHVKLRLCSGSLMSDIGMYHEDLKTYKLRNEVASVLVLGMLWLTSVLIPA